MSTNSILGIVSNIGTSNVNAQEYINNNSALLAESNLANIQVKNAELIKKQVRQQQQLRELEDKEKLILTRSRMLQIAQDRNAYKQKIIYSFIALILLIFICTILIYVLFTRKSQTNA
jgi:Flp pilus assembly protein TadB